MTEPNDPKTPSADDEAAAAAAVGGAGGPQASPFFKRDNAFAQESTDYNMAHNRTAPGFMPLNTVGTTQAGAFHNSSSGGAFGSADAQHTFRGPGGMTATEDANAFAGAKAGPTGVQAGFGAQISNTIQVNNNLSFGNSAYAGGSAGAGLGPKGLSANAQAGVGFENHIDAGVRGSLGHGVHGGTNTHIEQGLKAEAGARASFGMDNKVGANAFAGDYTSITQTGQISGGGLGAKASAGVIGAGSAGVGAHFGAGMSDGKLNLTFGGAAAIPIGGLTGDVTLSVDTSKVVDAAKEEGKALQWAGQNIAHGATIAGQQTANAFTTAGNQIAHSTTDAAHQTANAFSTAGNQIAHTTTAAAQQTANAFSTAGNEVAHQTVNAVNKTGDAFKTAGGGIVDAGKAVEHGFEDVGRGFVSVFGSGW